MLITFSKLSGIDSVRSEYVDPNSKQSDNQSTTRGSEYANQNPSQSDNQSDSSYQTHIYDVFVGGSLIKRDIPETGIYANDTGI